MYRLPRQTFGPMPRPLTKNSNLIPALSGPLVSETVQWLSSDVRLPFG